ncbi:(deoxy)nucleoside triphosphate pyrophosphohydrolase [Mycoplasmatota bacterium WC44]
MKKIEVVAAIVLADNKVFCAKRANKGEIALKWEFPGGKIESGETNEDALIREIKEELNSEIEIKEYFMTIEHQYSTFHLTMHSYLCELLSGNLELSEHVDSCWSSKDDLDHLDWADADIPIVTKLKDTL